jgi:hypothetical protein
MLAEQRSLGPMKTDIFDGEPWTEMDTAHLSAALGSGDTMEKAARFLLRSGTLDDVRRKAEELRLIYKSRGEQQRIGDVLTSAAPD